MARVTQHDTAAPDVRRSVRPGEHGYALGLAGFITSFFFSVVGLVLSIVGMVQSRRAGFKNPLALAGIIIGAVLTFLYVLGTVGLILAGIYAVNFCNQHPNARQCGEYNQQYQNDESEPNNDRTY